MKRGKNKGQRTITTNGELFVKLTNKMNGSRRRFFSLSGLSSSYYDRRHNVLIVLVLCLELLALHKGASALRCYKCSMTAPPQSDASSTTNTVLPNGTVMTIPATQPLPRLCANFDESDRYVVECPYSTLCMKKHFIVNLTHEVRGTLRDCAHQRYDYQDYQDGRWQLKVAIEEPYEEGCAIADDKGFRSARTDFCYCRGDLCNGAQSVLMTFNRHHKSNGAIYVFLVLLSSSVAVRFFL